VEEAVVLILPEVDWSRAGSSENGARKIYLAFIDDPAVDPHALMLHEDAPPHQPVL
jgi:hypothetical protein